MTFNLGVIDWSALTAISTFFAVVVALILPQLQIRRKLSFRAIDAVLLGGGDDPKGLGITIMNKSRVPVTLRSYGGRFLKPVDGNDAFVVTPELTAQLPITIPPLSASTIFSPQLRKMINDIREIDFFDSLGKMYRIRGAMIRRLKNPTGKPKKAQQPGDGSK